MTSQRNGSPLHTRRLLRVAAYMASTLMLGSTANAAEPETPEPAHGIAMHGEAAYDEGFPYFNYVNPEAPKGGTLRQAVVANGYDSFNPLVARGVAATGITTYFYDTLMASSGDEPFTAYGLIAESIETPEDRSYAIYNLRPEATFHDGHPITAEDVRFSWKVLTTEGHPFYRNYYAGIEKVTIENEHRVRFDFGETSNRELPLIIGQMPILPAHYWEGRTFGENGLEVPVGSGPYRIGDFDPGRSITYVRDKDYWAADLNVRKGRFNFDQIRFDYYSDDTVALEGFKAGNFDFRAEYSAKNWATAYTGDKFESGRIHTDEVEHHRPAGMQAFVMNTRKPVFRDPKVREALAYAFDFRWANKNLFFDQYSRTSSYFENSELASKGLPEGRELEILESFRSKLPEDVFKEAYEPPATEDRSGLRDNLRTAMTMLRDAGYEIRDRKLVHSETGQPLAFEILLHQKNFERIVLPFKENLEKLGMEVTVRLVDTSQYIRRVREFDYDMITQVLPQSDSPGNEQRDYWHSSNVDVTGSRNYMGVADPVVDELVAMIIAAPDRKELVYRTRALDRVLLHGHYVIPQWYMPRDRIAYWDHLQRPEKTPKDGVDVNNWWVKN
jgi:microcin C transport system substrate-binding protein